MNTYNFTGLPITPSIIEILIIELFNGQTVKRDDIVKKIFEHHISNGGLRSEAQDFPRSVKKALERLQEKGDAKNISPGYWAILKNDVPIQIVEEQNAANEIDEIPTHASYGHGDFAVYLYYFPTYKLHAQSQGKHSWPCKIGRTEREPLLRILSQVSTGLPEVPVVEFVIKTNKSSILEKMLHAVLKLRNKHIKDSPGSEWFDTNPDEVLEIVKYVNKDLL